MDMVSPQARTVHKRRTTSRLLGSGWWETNVIPGQQHRGVFELKYGYPTDVDAVWADREAEHAA